MTWTLHGYGLEDVTTDKDGQLRGYGYSDTDIRVQLSGPKEDGYSPECPECGNELAEYLDGWQGHELTCIYVMCGMCGSTRDAAGVCVNDECDDFGHTVPPIDPYDNPLTWCNSAAITIDPDDNSVVVSISVADPRGAFAFTVRRTSDGTLIMHVPYPEYGLLHASLKELHPGTYQIGG